MSDIEVMRLWGENFISSEVNGLKDIIMSLKVGSIIISQTTTDGTGVLMGRVITVKN